jgi:hypothetical protein
MTTKTATDGDLVAPMTTELRNALRAPRGSTPRTGTNVALWRLVGSWHVWSDGPASGTWWLKAVDQEAAELAALLERKPSRGAPVVVKVWKDCIAVASKEIRPRGRA